MLSELFLVMVKMRRALSVCYIWDWLLFIRIIRSRREFLWRCFSFCQLSNFDTFCNESRKWWRNRRCSFSLIGFAKVMFIGDCRIYRSRNSTAELLSRGWQIIRLMKVPPAVNKIICCFNSCRYDTVFNCQCNYDRRFPCKLTWCYLRSNPKALTGLAQQPTRYTIGSFLSTILWFLVFTDKLLSIQWWSNLEYLNARQSEAYKAEIHVLTSSQNHIYGNFTVGLGGSGMTWL